MRSTHFDGLAREARAGGLSVKRLVLLAQAEAFATAPARGPGAVARFEALVLGLAPLVDDETALTVLRRLAPLGDTPPGLLAALARPPAAPAPGASGQPSPARGVPARPAPLGGRPLAEAVDAARQDAGLAATLLAREDLPARDHAALWTFADRDARDAIRAGLADRLHGVSPAGLGQSGRAAALLAVADREGSAGLLAFLAEAFGSSQVEGWRLEREADAELLALALVAVGLAPEECVALVLRLDHAVGRTVALVFRIAAVARGTARTVAAGIVACALGLDTLGKARPDRRTAMSERPRRPAVETERRLPRPAARGHATA